MANQTDNIENQEINLSDVSRKVKNYFSKANDSFFDGILFVKRNIIIVVALIIAGAGLGYYQDYSSRQYEQKIFVMPNFGSTDYVYEEVEGLISKIRKKDPDFIKNSGIKDLTKISMVKIEPVVEIYDFIEDKDVDEDDRKFQLFRLISENGDMKKILEDKITSRGYKKHLITVTTNETVSRDEAIDPILNYFNNNPYFVKMKKEYANNLDLKIAANDTVIKQIDRILNDYASRKNNGSAMYYVDNTQLNEVIKLKNRLTVEQGQNRIDRANYDKVLAESGTMLNVPKKGLLVGKMKYITPLLFIGIFVLIFRFRKYYAKQLNKRKIAG